MSLWLNVALLAVSLFSLFVAIRAHRRSGRSLAAAERSRAALSPTSDSAQNSSSVRSTAGSEPVAPSERTVEAATDDRGDDSMPAIGGSGAGRGPSPESSAGASSCRGQS